MLKYDSCQELFKPFLAEVLRNSVIIMGWDEETVETCVNDFNRKYLDVHYSSPAELAGVEIPFLPSNSDKDQNR